MLIACEGIDGSGKSTLVQDLGNYFITQGHPVILTKEPGGTPFGKQLRTMLQQPTAHNIITKLLHQHYKKAPSLFLIALLILHWCIKVTAVAYHTK